MKASGTLVQEKMALSHLLNGTLVKWDGFAQLKILMAKRAFFDNFKMVMSCVEVCSIFVALGAWHLPNLKQESKYYYCHR